MGTKNNPGKYDCYEKAEPDEPLFVLIGRDQTASDFVDLWAHIHNAAPISAFETFIKIYQNIQWNTNNKEKVFEAFRCANDMRNYFVNLPLEVKS